MTLLTSGAFLRGTQSSCVCVKRSVLRAEQDGSDLTRDCVEATGAGAGFDKHGHGSLSMKSTKRVRRQDDDLARQRTAASAERISSSVM